MSIKEVDLFLTTMTGSGTYSWKLVHDYCVFYSNSEGIDFFLPDTGLTTLSVQHLFIMFSSLVLQDTCSSPLRWRIGSWIIQTECHRIKQRRGIQVPIIRILGTHSSKNRSVAFQTNSNISHHKCVGVCSYRSQFIQIVRCTFVYQNQWININDYCFQLGNTENHLWAFLSKP